jgi:hypothetical protein
VGKNAADTNSNCSTSNEFQSVLQADDTTVGPFLLISRFAAK